MLPFIHTAETFYGAGADLTCRPSERAFLLHTPRAFPLIQQHLHRRGETEQSIVTVAWVERGAWVAECPFCPSAQVVTPADPFFFCAGDDGCANITVHGAEIPIEFPSARDRKRIERELLKRPQLHNRNWLHYEPLEVLRAENIEHGLEKV